MNVADRLRGGNPRSLGRVPEVITLVLGDPARLDDLYASLFDSDPVVRMRAGDAMEKVARQRPILIKPYLDRLLSEVAAVDQPSVQWHLAQMLGEVPLSRSQRERAVTLLKRNLGRSVDKIVICLTLQALADLDDGADAGLRAWLVETLRHHMTSESKSIATRARRLLAGIDSDSDGQAVESGSDGQAIESDNDGKAKNEAVLTWLLAGDPSIRWQVLGDLVGAASADRDAERDRVAVEGWGARLLAAQDADARWGQRLYSPKWTSTTYTLLLLHRLGLPSGHARAQAGCQQLWDGARFYGGGLNLAKSIRQPETCITAMLVLLASSFGHEDMRVEEAVGWLLDQQLGDGGWNCETVRSGSRHGSFHTSISTLEALLEYERSGGRLPVMDAMEHGRGFFLDHRLYRSHRTGEVVSGAFTRFPFPPQWHYDVLRGLEHFRAAGAATDERLADAVQVVRRARKTDGTWPTYRAYPGRKWFSLEPTGPSRWSTLRALRVLRWWDAQHGPTE